MKVIGFIAIALVVVVAAILIFATTKPDSFRVERTANIKAPSWSPWENKDPAMKRTYSGAASGKGSVYEWEGNKDIGQGRMEIAEETPPSHIVIAMHFIKPFDSYSTAEFMLQPKGETTDVTWAMHGPSAYITKVIGVFMSMDTMIGKEFETGLANLKTVAERS